MNEKANLEQQKRTHTGGPAFPVAGHWGLDSSGMSLRDFFAAHVIDRFSYEGDFIGAAAKAYALADAMLQERITPSPRRTPLPKNMSTRTRNCLMAEGITDIETLQTMSDKDILDIPNAGVVTVREIRAMCPPATEKLLKKETP